MSNWTNIKAAAWDAVVEARQDRVKAQRIADNSGTMESFRKAVIAESKAQDMEKMWATMPNE